MFVQTMLGHPSCPYSWCSASTRLLSPAPEAVCQLETKLGWQRVASSGGPRSLDCWGWDPLAQQRLFSLQFHVPGELYRCDTVLRPETGPLLAF